MMVIVILSFGWGVFLDVWLVSVCFSAARATVSCVAAASCLEGKCQGVCSHTGGKRGGKHARRKLETRPEC